MPSRRELARRCGAAIDAVLLAGFAATLLAFGGRHAGGQFLYAATVALAALLTALRTSLGEKVEP